MERHQLLNTIISLELTLSLNEIDKFNVSKRKINSRKKHLGVTYLGEAKHEKLEAYREHLRSKLNL